MNLIAISLAVLSTHMRPILAQDAAADEKAIRAAIGEAAPAEEENLTYGYAVGAGQEEGEGINPRLFLVLVVPLGSASLVRGARAYQTAPAVDRQALDIPSGRSLTPFNDDVDGAA